MGAPFATSGRPGSSPEIQLRGPTSINASGRSQQPLIIVDGAILRVGNLNDIGALDIESVEVVKGAAGASLYGTTAANGVIIIKTKRGANRDGVTWNSVAGGLTLFQGVTAAAGQWLAVGANTVAVAP